MKRGFKQFLLLWGASLVSATGSGMTSFALGIYIFQKTEVYTFLINQSSKYGDGGY